MPITPNIVNPQEMEIVVGGPDGANRLYIFSGMAQFYLADYSGSSSGWPVRDTLTFLVGPTFSAGQVHKAIAVGAVSGVTGPGPAALGGVSYQVGVSVDSIDADWDDDSGQVRVTANLASGVPPRSFKGLASRLRSLQPSPEPLARVRRRDAGKWIETAAST